MPEKITSGAPGDATSIDPIAFDDATIFGLDPPVHWIRWNNEQDQFPEVVLHITQHWNDSDWLLKLLKRLGYTADLYAPARNTRGIFERLPVQERSRLTALRLFLLRAAGVTEEKIHHMFGLSPARWRFARTNLEDVINRRRAAVFKASP
jgi:hypothetical protein